jgi:hypothetical protein
MVLSNGTNSSEVSSSNGNNLPKKELNEQTCERMEVEDKKEDAPKQEDKVISMETPTSWLQNKPKKKRRGNLPKPATNLFKRWLFDHLVRCLLTIC